MEVQTIAEARDLTRSCCRGVDERSGRASAATPMRLAALGGLLLVTATVLVVAGLFWLALVSTAIPGAIERLLTA